MKLNYFFTLLLFSINTLSAQTVSKIGDLKIKDTSNVFTVRGIATNGAELGTTIRYIQDGTGGIAVFYTVAAQPEFAKIKRGDSIEVTGKLKSFNALLEIDPLQSFKVISSDNIVKPITITADQLSNYPSTLVRINNGRFTDGKINFGGATNYNLSFGATKIQARVNNGSLLVGKPIPTSSLDLVGINSAFNATFQVLPRDSADLFLYPNILGQAPTVNNIKTTSLNINWQTTVSGSTSLVYGTSATSLTSAIDSANLGLNHTISLTGLTPATIYYVQVSSTANGITSVSNIFPVITSSLSSGEMRVYFNHSVDSTVAKNGNKPLATTGNTCESAYAAYFDKATKTIDVAFYSNGDTVLINALKNAVKRGVRVRYVTDNSTSIAAFGDTSQLGFKLQRSYSTNLMHNKFFVIDADNVNNCWIYTGAMNWSIGQLFTDYNNALLIQDQSLARIYTVEFEEMWGGATANYVRSTSKFSTDKSNNTPHSVNINGKLVEVYFSPSDNAASALIRNMDAATKDIQFENLVFTSVDLSTAMINASKRKLKIRGIVDGLDTSSSSSKTLLMSNNGIQVKIWEKGVQFHHKTCIIDALSNDASLDPKLITGSYNWSGNGESFNDENVVIVHDLALANIYLQEFEARWKEAKGFILSTSDQISDGLKLDIAPNPAREIVKFNINNDVSNDLVISIYNSSGQNISSFILSNGLGNSERSIDVSNFTNGQYFVRVASGKSVLTQSFVVLR